MKILRMKIAVCDTSSPYFSSQNFVLKNHIIIVTTYFFYFSSLPFFSSPILVCTCNDIFSKTILGVPDHENYENFQIGPSFHRPSIYCLYLEKQLQGTGSSNVVFGHGRPYIFLTMLFRGKRRGGHCFFFHSGIILVGYYYYDHCGVW